MSGDTILWAFLLIIVVIAAAFLAGRIIDGIRPAPPAREPVEHPVDDDEADTIYPFRRIGPVANDVVAKLDGGR